MGIKLIVGLRNPGSAYTKTRHNAGAWFVEALAKHANLPFQSEKKLQTELVDGDCAGNRCKLALPTCFMNHSGTPVQAIAQFYRILPEEILICHDDLDLPPGRVKLKIGKGHGGHNGLKDIMNKLASADFHRLRIGIGHPGHRDLVLDYVLGVPTATDRSAIDQAIEKAVCLMPEILSGNIQRAMDQLHTPK